jgi:hypothetical protein
VVAALVAGLLVAGCSGGDEPPEEPLDPGSSPGAVYTGEPLPERVPEMPAEARKHTLAGAEAMMGHYFDAYEYAFLTSDARPLKPLVAGDCSFCTDVLADFDFNSKHGYKGEGGRISTSGTKAQWFKRDSSALVSTTVHQDESRMLSRDGAVALRSPAKETAMDLQLEWVAESSAWRVVSVVPR